MYQETFHEVAWLEYEPVRLIESIAPPDEKHEWTLFSTQMLTTDRKDFLVAVWCKKEKAQ